MDTPRRAQCRTRAAAASTGARGPAKNHQSSPPRSPARIERPARVLAGASRASRRALGFRAPGPGPRPRGREPRDPGLLSTPGPVPGFWGGSGSSGSSQLAVFFFPSRPPALDKPRSHGRGPSSSASVPLLRLQVLAAPTGHGHRDVDPGQGYDLAARFVQLPRLPFRQRSSGFRRHPRMGRRGEEFEARAAVPETVLEQQGEEARQ